MIFGALFPFDFLVVWFIAACYVLCPRSIIERKNEYVKFFLLFLSAYFLLLLTLHYVLGVNHDYNDPYRSARGALAMIAALGFCPALFVANLVYPFRTVRRSQHLGFFTFMISLCSLGVLGLLLFSFVFFSNM